MSDTKALLTRIKHDFSAYGNVSEEAVKGYANIRSILLRAARSLVKECPAGRELSLAITNLEQAMFWANVAIAREE